MGRVPKERRKYLNESRYFPTLKYIGMAEGKFNTHKLGSQREHMIQQDTKILTNDTARY